MTIARIYVIALIAAIVIVTTTAITTVPMPAAAQQQQPPIYIIKDGTNSYTISGSASFIGSFDTTYRIAGERSDIRAAENLIINVIARDFNSSRTVGYVRAANMTTTATGVTPEPTLPSPFATPEQITERITSELRRVITEAENSTPQGQHVEIKCDFGMSLDDMLCHYIPSAGSGAAGGSTPTTSTNTTGTTTADTTAPISPLEGE